MASLPALLSLTQAGEAVASVSLTFAELVNNTPNVDPSISQISKDILSITNLLFALETVVEQLASQVSRLAPIDSLAWQPINNVLVDCAANATALRDLVIPDPWPSQVMDLLEMRGLQFRPEDHKREVLAMRSRTHNSKCAIRTALAVANLSLSFHPNTPQDTIFDGLALLNKTFRDTLQVAYTETAQFESRAHEFKNLEALGRMAELFHSKSNTTALRHYGYMPWSELEEIDDGRRKSTDTLYDREKPKSAGNPRQGSLLKNQLTRGALTTVDNEEAKHYLYTDMPRDFEDLASKSFERENYQRAEQCLRVALAQLAGDKLQNKKCMLLKLRLAVCCCLQDKWNYAIGLVDVLPKTLEKENLPIFHVLQALSLSYLKHDMLDEAFSACDTALQAKKKILGAQHDECYDCQFILASICEKRGMHSDAEALRRTIPLTWTPDNYGDLLCTKQCILNNGSFLKHIFSPDMQKNFEPPRIGVSDRASGHWTTLVLGNPPDGEHRAEYDEERNVSLAQMDTGKEAIVEARSTENSVSDVGLKRYSPAKTKPPIPVPGGTPTTYFEDTDSMSTDVQSLSSLPQLATAPSMLLCANKVTELSSGMALTTFDRIKKRWEIERDLSNMKGYRPAGAVPFSTLLHLSRPIQFPKGCFLAVSARCQAGDSFALRKVNGEVEIFQMPLTRSLPSVADTRFFISRSASSVASPFPNRQGNPLTSTLRFTVDLEQPRDWALVLNDSKPKISLIGREREIRNNLKTATNEIETHISKQIVYASSPAGLTSSITQLRVASLVYTVPDIVYRTCWSLLLDTLVHCDLMQHAGVIPHSVAVVQQCIDALRLHIDPDPVEPMGVIVLNCDEILVECVPLSLRVGSPGTIRIQHLPTTFVAETAGCGHVRATFARLVEGRLKSALDKLAREMSNSDIEDIVQSCCKQFDQRIFTEFEDAGDQWRVEFDFFPDMHGYEHGRCNFTNEEMAACFSPSVEMVKKMLRATVEGMRAGHSKVSRILLAGPYSKSKYLHKVLRELVRELNEGFADEVRIKIIGSRLSGDHICGLGALSFAMSA